MKEIYKEIKNYEGRYAVSNTGQVMSYLNGGLLKSVKNKKGYMIVRLYKDGKGCSKRVHRLVAEAFLPNPDNLPEVDHKDRCRHNNVVGNLRGASGSENTRNRAYCEQATSEFNGVHKLTVNGKWMANITVNRVTVYLGTFADSHTAAMAFDKYCIENKINRQLNILTMEG